MQNTIHKIIFFTLFLLTLSAAGHCDDAVTALPEGTPLSLSDFILQSTQKDTEFEQILVDDMILNYQRDLRLPAADIILSVKEQYHYFIEADKERGETSVSLSRLFPMTGTELEAAYDSTPVSAVSRNNSSLSFSVTQPIAENAFGKSTRLLDQLIGVEVDVARHQVTEAYEDYLALIILEYLNWQESYENLKIGISSYKENVKLLQNIQERKKSNIALPIDVYKVEIQVLEKKEALISFRSRYVRQSNIISRILRLNEGEFSHIPDSSADNVRMKGDFENLYSEFTSSSRTYQVFDLLEKRSDFQVQRDADDLLPSINLKIGYEMEGTDFDLSDNDRLFYGAVQMDWPLPDSVEKAEYEISRLNLKKTGYDIRNTHYRLYSQLKNIYEEIVRESNLKSIADEKINFARSVLEAETENYTFGKVTLNDYIRAVNALDSARFNLVSRTLQIQKLRLEWKRLTDTLITSEEIRNP
ncbi:MAG: TolC family protein [Candidatus Omnitrophica bacterium]|nr:TolC family protein [Candidatus Omnitrophota bacterium]